MKTSLLFIILFVASTGFGFQNQLSPSVNFVRVRLFKDLNHFPVVTGSKMKSISENIISLEGESLNFQNKKISGKNLIIQKPNHKYDLISIIDFNSYLAGVVSKEMPLSWPLEALKAQAVIARSYAMAKILERGNKIYHLDNDQMDQVFDFTNSDKAKMAADSTDQVILKDSNDKVLKAFYHSDCGGQTVPASQIWKGAFDSGTATDPWCEKRKSNEWIYELSQDDFYKRLGLSSEDDQKLEVDQNFKNRIQSFKVSNQFFPVQKLREIFGFSQIKNSPLSFKHTPEGIVVFKGKGFGHGAGLCQWGTLSQVKIGRSYIEVLEHYYPKAILTFKSPKLSSLLSKACIPSGANCIALR